MEAFEKSERIRSEQKELIQNMKRDMLKVRTVQILQEEERQGSTKRPESPAPIINLEVVQRSSQHGFTKQASSRNSKGILNI